MRSMRGLLLVLALAPTLSLSYGCATAPSAATVSAADYDASGPMNPTTEAGAAIYRSFGDHHPTCFVLLEDGNTDDVACPEDGMLLLDRCPGGMLYPGKGQAEGACVCVPLDGDAAQVACP
jgi:hypothetical protein